MRLATLGPGLLMRSRREWRANKPVRIRASNRHAPGLVGCRLGLSIKATGARIVDASTVVSLLGALGIGSVAGQYAASGSQRRGTRAAVLEALNHTESARWVGAEQHDPSFNA